jgi:eukaryotic-like serine/threonine-protein kinase
MLAPGTRIGPYEITGELGAGGMGEVYRARDQRLGRDVALKVLPDTYSTDPDRLARFQREAQVLASLKHPNIGAIYGLEAGPAEAGAHSQALVLELIEGETLADRIAQGPLPVREALPIALQIADALEAAHEQGIIHRDLKPANVRITPDGIVKVLDFGLAKRGTEKTAEFDEQGNPVARGGLFAGTPAFAAPELLAGDERLDGRADLYSLGCVAFWLLTGRPLFQSGGVMAMVLKHLREPPEHPSRIAKQGVPPALEALILQCLEKAPEARPASAAEVLARLADIPLAEPWTDARALHWWETHKPTEPFEQAA